MEIRHNGVMLRISGVATLILLACAAAVVQAGVPQRIVSISQCTDQLLLMMVERERIVSVSYFAADKESSYMAKAVGGIPQNHTGAEEVMSFKPDLIVGSTFASHDAAQMLRELGYKVQLSEPPTTLAGVRDIIREFGEWTGSQQKAQQLIADMDARLATVHARNDSKPQRSIMGYSPNGVTFGRHTLEDDIFREAGFRNLSAEMGVEGFQAISMERLVAAHPDFVQIDNYIYNQNSLASSYINHPVLNEIVPADRRLYVPTPLRDCAGPMVVDAIDYLASRR
jgi:iron complex transport system substrate-binding protein